jgi:hypothetical protein
MIKRKSLKSLRVTSLNLIRRLTISMVPQVIGVKEEAEIHNLGGHGGLARHP